MHAPKAPKAPKAEKHNDATEHKLKNANKPTKIKNVLKKNLRGGGRGSHLFAYFRFCAFWAREEKEKINKKMEKREKSPQNNALNTAVPTTWFM